MYTTLDMNKNSIPRQGLIKNKDFDSRFLTYRADLNRINIDTSSSTVQSNFNTTTNSTAPTTNSEVNQYTDMMSQNKPAAIFLLLFLFLWFASCVYSYKAWGRAEEEEESEANSGDTEEGISPLATKISKMNAQERMELYNKAFEENKHQTVIQASSIIRGDPNATTSDTEDDSSELEEDPSIYLALETARSVRRSSVLRKSTKLGVDMASAELNNKSTKDDEKKTQNNNKKQNRRRSSLIHPRASMMDLENGGGNTASSNIVRGNCVICFEDIEAGETVVWSEHNACQHVYHKECMVAYLAHKKRTVKEIELDENPCPTCRRKFVTVCPSNVCTSAE